MRRVWHTLSPRTRNSPLSLQTYSQINPKTLIKPTISPNTLRSFHNDVVSSSPEKSLYSIIPMFGDYPRPAKRAEIVALKDELVRANGDVEAVNRVLEGKGLGLLLNSSDGLMMMIEVLKLLYPFPNLALQVFEWRRKHDGFTSRISAEEYVKGITVASKARKVDLAVELFTEAANNHAKTSSTYNALMSAYMNNGFPERCRSLFETFKKDETCIPNITTYNILISLFGRMMLVHDMEETLRKIYDLNLSPNVSTFNNLISGYITAWMWDCMENAYERMKTELIEPDNETYLLLIRGYSHSGNLTKMEEIYALVKEDVFRNNLRGIESMMSAYYKSSSSDRVEKSEALLKLFSNEEYSPWLNVLLIRLYAEEHSLEKMEKYIDLAFENHIMVTSVAATRDIATAYYRVGDVDRLTRFRKRAESHGWMLCESVYKMIDCVQGTKPAGGNGECYDLSEMKDVKDEPNKPVNIGVPL